MKKKSTKPWILMLAAPLLLWGFVMIFHWLFAGDANSGTVVNDNLLNIGMVVTVLGFYGAFATLVLYPVWIFMLIRAKRHNNRTHFTPLRGIVNI